MKAHAAIDTAIVTPVEMALIGQGLVGIDIRTMYLEGVLLVEIECFGDIEREGCTMASW